MFPALASNSEPSLGCEQARHCDHDQTGAIVRKTCHPIVGFAGPRVRTRKRGLILQRSKCSDSQDG